MAEKCKHVSGQFEQNRSKFIHINVKPNVISVYLRTAKRHWAYPMLNLVGGLIIPLMMYYYWLSNFDVGLHDP